MCSFYVFSNYGDHLRVDALSKNSNSFCKWHLNLYLSSFQCVMQGMLHLHSATPLPKPHISCKFAPFPIHVLSFMSFEELVSSP